MKQAKTWREHVEQIPAIAVNISSKQLRSDEFRRNLSHSVATSRGKKSRIPLQSIEFRRLALLSVEFHRVPLMSNGFR